MRLPRVRFTVRQMMVAVAVISLYLAAFHLATDLGAILVVWTAPPILWTSVRAEWRSSSEDAMSGVEWAANFTLASIVHLSLGLAIWTALETILSAYRDWMR